MAQREALRELQARLAERLQQVRGDVRTARWLAVECGRHGFLFPLAGAGEIFAAGSVTPLPHTKPWFLGVANLRGALHGVFDLTMFLGLETRPVPWEQSQIVAFNPALASHSAVLVHRLAGLRHADQMTLEPEEADPRPSFAGQRLIDAQGRTWQEIDLSALARHEEFLAISR